MPGRRRCATNDDPFVEAGRDLDESLETKRAEYAEARKSQQFRQETSELDKLTQDFIFGLRLAYFAFTRYPHQDEWMLQRFTDDLLESAVSVALLAREGVFNVGRRELRYVLEATTKYVYVDQQVPGEMPLTERVAFLANNVPRSSVDPIHNVTFRLIDSKAGADAVDSAFGALSGYTHASRKQLDERLVRASRGESTGFESARTLASFNRLLRGTYDLVLALIFEGIGPAFTRDLFENGLAEQSSWRYNKTKFVMMARERVVG